MTAVKSNYVLCSKTKPLSPVKVYKKIKAPNFQKLEDKKLIIQNHLKNQPIYKFQTKTKFSLENENEHKN